MDTKDTAAATSGGSSSSSNSSSSSSGYGAINAGSQERSGSNGGSGSRKGIGGRDGSSNEGSSGTSGTSSSNGSAPKPRDLVFLPVTQLAKLLADDTVTSQQLVTAFRDRLQRYDATLHAAVTITSQLADSQAAAAQQALSAAAASARPATKANTEKVGKDAGSSSGSPAQSMVGSAASLLSGVPYGLKDLFAVPGYPTTWGLSALRNRTIDTVRPPGYLGL
jgi:hypothetical protein